MDKQKYLEMFGKNLVVALETTKAKNQDYCGDNEPFHNFRDPDGINQIDDDVCRSILSRMRDKYRRCINVLGAGKTSVTTETVTDTLLDLMVYSNILLTYLQAKAEEDAITAKAEGEAAFFDNYYGTPTAVGLVGPGLVDPTPAPAPTITGGLRKLFGMQ